ncbi:MAG: S8 family serine peptidase [Woeseiaceae bacterium]
MNKATLACMLVGIWMIASGLEAQAQGARPSVVPDAYIVKVTDGVEVDRTARDVAALLGGRVRHVYTEGFRGFAIHVPRGVTWADLLADPRIARVEPDLTIPLPPFPVAGPLAKGGNGGKGGKGGKDRAGQQVPTGVQRIGTLENTTANIDGIDDILDVDIAILDSGIASHPDLNVVGGVNCIGGSCIAALYEDDYGHGTHVAGIAAAIDNDIGVVGVAPGARLWAIKTHGDQGSADLADIIAGIDWVVGHAEVIEVANMSFGRFTFHAALRDAIIAGVGAGVVFVAAAGNSSSDIYGPDGQFAISDLYAADDFIPAAFPEVAAVSAMADSDGKAGGSRGKRRGYLEDTIVSWSNYSAFFFWPESPVPRVDSSGAAMDLAAPGENIYSTALGGGYVTSGGTSMASAPRDRRSRALHCCHRESLHCGRGT